MKSYSIIFHIDMNCFYASCEIANDPSLKGKPVVVGRLDPLRKGIIVSPSYEARKYGIKATMKIRDALLLCPNLEVVEPTYGLYDEMSKKFFEYFRSITPYVEPASIDEGYLDVTEVCEKVNAIELANNIQKHLYENIGLPCSIGIAPNKFLAKMASDMKKPMGITILRKREIDKYLWPLDISDMFGVGTKTAPKLREIGIITIGDLANYPNMEKLEKCLGPVYSKTLVERANGIDNSQVIYEDNDDVSSVSNSHTFDFNTKDERKIKTTLKILTNSVAYRLSESKKCTKTIGIQLKYDDFTMVNRSVPLKNPTNDANLFYREVETLYDEYNEEFKDIRLVGVFANRISNEEENITKYTIFDDLDKLEKEHQIGNLLKSINEQFGSGSIKKGK